MMRVNFGLLIALLLASCSQRSNHLQLHALTNSLENSNKLVIEDCLILYKSIENKTKDPATARKALLWQPKVLSVNKMSRNLVDYIEALKVKLKIKASSTGNDTTHTFDEWNEKVVAAVFTEQNQAEILQEKLRDFARNASNELLLSSSEPDSIFVEFIRSNIAKLQASFPEGLHASNVSDHFKGTNVVNALAMLTKYQNDVLLAEHALVRYAFRLIPTGDEGYDRFSVLTVLNTSYLKRGEMLEVSAGVGAFSLERKPQITINGQLVPLTVEGLAVYGFKANNKPGKYTVPVRIEYTDYDGTIQVIEKRLRYTVMD